ncbi:hypothetical protein BO86DRAFT_408781 [Aspergillus japonicus CBS 114.51]|uniref:Uncharacterized protein n=1 Tax=Aspergillus japonicus CBS 114.51 TaxID=1448312 RepID=A0A8T8X557_ASPJA|nr:hypothetical protein BO86DRAFT_408781 [Aspergillus japonicus CBS 114.51]RAH83263.1 hypothetical protein BO86DRAFT_408781 [Aspergillus japonicus CBS 114.51]
MEPSEIEAINSFFRDTLDSPQPLRSGAPTPSSSSAVLRPVPSWDEAEVMLCASHIPITSEMDIDSYPPDVTPQLAAISLTDPAGPIDIRTVSTPVAAGSGSRQEVRLSCAQVEQIHATKEVLMAQQTEIAGLRTNLRKIHAGLRHGRHEAVRKVRDYMISWWEITDVEAARLAYDRHADDASKLAMLRAVSHPARELEAEYQRVDWALTERENRLVQSMEDLAGLLDQLRVSFAGGVSTEEDYEGAVVAGEGAVGVVSSREHGLKAFSHPEAAQRLRELRGQLDELDGQMVSMVEVQKIENPLVSDRRLERDAVEFMRTYDERRMNLFREYRARLSFLETLTARHVDPLRLSSHELKKSSIFEPAPVQSPSPNVFVNQWLLFQLRTSSLEAARIRSLPEWQALRGQGWTDAGISRLALMLWFSDDTVRPYTGSTISFPVIVFLWWFGFVSLIRLGWDDFGFLNEEFFGGVCDNLGIETMSS